MKNTEVPFSLGANVMVEITDGTIRQLRPVTNELIREIPVSSLNAQQVAAIEAARERCAKASVEQGFRPAGFTNTK